MLTKYSPTTTPLHLPSRLEQDIRIRKVAGHVWGQLYDGTGESFAEYLDRVIYVYEFNEGGVVVYADDIDKTVSWLDAAGHNFISVDKFIGLLVVLKAIGLKTIAANTKRNDAVARLYQWTGFQQLDKHLWSLQLNA